MKTVGKKIGGAGILNNAYYLDRPKFRKIFCFLLFCDFSAWIFYAEFENVHKNFLGEELGELFAVA